MGLNYKHNKNNSHMFTNLFSIPVQIISSKLINIVYGFIKVPLIGSPIYIPFTAFLYVFMFTFFLFPSFYSI